MIAVDTNVLIYACDQVGASLAIEGLTKEGLAHAAGITTSYASQVERAEKVPTLTVILKLCRALNLTPGELLSDFTAASIKRLRFD